MFLKSFLHFTAFAIELEQSTIKRALLLNELLTASDVMRCLKPVGVFVLGVAALALQEHLVKLVSQDTGWLSGFLAASRTILEG